MDVLFINLDRDVGRQTYIVDQLRGLGLPFERFPALTPDDLPHHLSRRFDDTARSLLTRGEIGNFASHLAILERIAARQDDAWTLVLEDDVEIAVDAASLLDIAQIATGANAHLVRLSAPTKHAARRLARAGRFSVLKLLVAPRGTGAYLVNRDGANQLLRHANGIAMVTDWYFREQANRGVRTLGVHPVPIPQDRYGASSIDPTKARQTSATLRRRRQHYSRGSLGQQLMQRTAFVAQFGALDMLRALAHEAWVKSVRRKPPTETLLFG